MFWGIEEDYEAAAERDAIAQSENAPAPPDVVPADVNYVESAAEAEWRRQADIQNLESIASQSEGSYEKTANVQAVKQISTDKTMTIAVLGLAALGLFFFLRPKK